MENEPGITRICLPLPYRLGTVNCYLIAASGGPAETGSGYVLVDTGCAGQRASLEKALLGAGCRPGDLKLIVLTHGDFDHTGNAAYLRDRFGARIAMHQGDSGMAERGDMFSNRKSANAILRTISPLLFGFGRAERFVPDLYVEDGDDLDAYGLAAQIVHIPGHSSGSIGVLTAGGSLFVGDLLENTGQPAYNSIMDDATAAQASIEKLQGLPVQTIYPGHGKPFAWAQFLQDRR
ncbi:MAG TPA: MBL fold metallo-hydrolase [Anaerolineae bacterium]|nr:MBL fold metallo-hydrolase [Anaerolineae bacterium]